MAEPAHKQDDGREQVIRGPATIERRFREEQSIGARVNRRERQRRRNESIRNTRINGRAANVARNQSSDTPVRSRNAQEQMQAQVTQRASGLLLKNLRGVSSGAGIGILTLAYSFQFPLAIISAVAFGIFAVYEGYIGSDSILGSLLSLVGSGINGLSHAVLGFDILFPPQYIGLAFWILSSIINGFLFFAFYVWFRIFGVRPFLGGPLYFLFSVTLLFCSILPFINIFPCVIIWVSVINVTSLFSRK